METIQGQTIQGVSLEIDGKHFIDCTLIDCILEYRGNPVNYERTKMRGCRHVFFGRARSTLHYLQNVGLMPHNSFERGEFPEVVH